MTASPCPLPTAEDARLALLLAAQGLVPDRHLDRSDDYLTLCCLDAAGQAWVLKYCHSRSPDALRRLRNEALLTRRLPVRPPLRLLRHRADGDGWLLTAFERGEPLGPQHLGEPALMRCIAEALVELQAQAAAVRDLGLSRRESTRRFLLKVLLKHVLHLYPDHLRLRDAWRCYAVLRTGLNDIAALGVPCHADCMPTNMLRDADGGSVVLLDLEGFIVEHHPLYDVLSFMTIDTAPLAEWHWQPGFLRHFLARSPLAPRIAAGTPAFARVYRALLIFLLAYRFNEALINAVDGRYFDGGPKAGWVARRLALLAVGAGLWRRRPALAGPLAVRRENLERALDPAGFAAHLRDMLGTGAGAMHAA